MKRRAMHMITAFTIPVMLLLGIYAIWGQYPFGDRSLLIWDMNLQYAPFLHIYMISYTEMLRHYIHFPELSEEICLVLPHTIS